MFCWLILLVKCLLNAIPTQQRRPLLQLFYIFQLGAHLIQVQSESHVHILHVTAWQN